MKKQAFLILAGGIMAMASCTTQTTNTTSQEQIDSMVNARVEVIRTEMIRSNDSMINALAQIKADSMLAAMKGQPTVAHKPATGKTAPAKSTTSPQVIGSGSSSVTTTPVNSKESRFNGQNNGTNKESRFNPDAAKKQDATTNKKEDRFK